MPEETPDLKVQIAEAHARLDGHDDKFKSIDDRLDRHEAHIAKLTEIASDIRAAQAVAATKDDVKDLSKDIAACDIRAAERHIEDMKRAFDSIPTKVMLWLTVALVLVTLLPWLIQHFHR